MKKIILVTILSLSICSFFVELNEEINLPPPQRKGGVTLYEAVSNRRTKRDFIDKSMSLELVSQALWMCYGINELPDKRTVPASKKYYSFVNYVFMKNGTFTYNYQRHSLTKVQDGDHRSTVKVRDAPKIVNASMILCQITDYDYPSEFYRDKGIKKLVSDFNSGYCAYGLSLLAASEGMQNVPLAGMDNQRIITDLGLDPDRYETILCFAIGYGE